MIRNTCGPAVVSAALLLLGCGGGSSHDGGAGGTTLDGGAGTGGAAGTDEDAATVPFDAGIDLSQPADHGLVFGTVTPPPVATAVAPAASRADASSDILPGRLILAFRPGHGQDASGLHGWKGLGGYRFAHHAHVGPNMIVVDVSDAARPRRALGRDETHEVVRRLHGHPALAVVDVDRKLRRVQLPNDPAVPAMWHLRHANIPAAWEVDTGSPGTIVAVVDDGVKAHPDLPALLPGYDFISDPASAADGDGRDANPSPEAFVDPIDGVVVWHGEHVAGTIAAVAGNASGIAGINWHCRILPVRVLGRDGATSSDVIAGLYWAAGIAVPGVPDNPTPAQVINLSLGSQGKGLAEQKAVADITARGVVLVAAAGNDGVDATGWSYADYAGVIAVGALDRLGRRAAYSNFGAPITIMAPGGDMNLDADGDGQQDGVVSLWFSDDGRSPTLSIQQGTSMAAPHVTGVVSLLKAINPSLTPPQISAILTSTALASGECAEGCGAGALNAAAAVLQARTGATLSSPPALELSSDRLHVTAAGARVAVLNAGGGTLTWSLDQTGAQADALVATPSSGTVAGGSGTTVAFTVGRSLAAGHHTTYVRVTSDGGTRVLPVSFVVGAVTVRDIGFPHVFMYDGKANGQVAGATFTSAALGYTFFIKTSPGTWYLSSWDDLNNDNTMNAGDLWGLHPDTATNRTITVTTGGLLGPSNFALVPY